MRRYILTWHKCSEQLPNKNQRVLCVSYGSDIAVGVKCEPKKEGETDEDYKHRFTKAVCECLEQQKFSIGSVEIGCVDENGYWYDDFGNPIIVTPTIWAKLPIIPDYSEVLTWE